MGLTEALAERGDRSKELEWQGIWVMGALARVGKEKKVL